MQDKHNPKVIHPQDAEDSMSEEEITQSLNEEQLGQETVSADALKLKEVEDKYLRLYAEFDNYRKRVSKEKEDVAFVTTQRVFENIMEIKDHLEMALLHSKDEAASQTLRQGVELTLKQMEKFFENFNVKEINPVGSEGKAFDPNFHEAIQQEDSAAHKSGQVVRVFQKGYLFKDRLLRPARVSVAK